MSPVRRVASLALLPSLLLSAGVAVAQAAPPGPDAGHGGVTPPSAGSAPTPPSVGSAAAATPPTDQLVIDSLAPQPGGLTSDDVGRRAQSTSPDVAAKNEAVRAAAAQVDAAIVGYFPRLTGTAQYTRLSPLTPPAITIPGLGSFGFPIFLNNWNFQASVTLPISDYFLRITQAHSAASHNEESAKWDKVAAQAKAQTDAKNAYYTWVKALGQRTVLQRSLKASKDHLTDAQNLFKAGLSSKADVMATQAQVANGELAVVQADQYVLVAEEQLRVSMHGDPSEKFTVGENVQQDLPADKVDTAALKQEALDNRPELKSLAEGAESFDKQATVVRSTGLPRLDAFADAYDQNPNQRLIPSQDKFKATWDVGVRLTWTPNDLGTGLANSAVQSANAEKLRAQRAQVRDGIVIEAAQASLGLQTAIASIESAKAGVASAAEAYRVRKEMYRAGKATNVELTDAETNLFNAELTLVNAQVGLRVAKIAVDHAAGRDARRVADASK